MAIITISRKIGSMGDKIAKMTAETLGYEYIEKAHISEGLSRCGIPISDIDKYDEKKPSLWQTFSTQNELFAQCIRATVCELAARDNVVILGRGGQAILKNIPGILHVRVIAPFKTRMSRLMEQSGDEEENVQRLIQQSDFDSSGYLSTNFQSNIDDSDLYDLVINTRTLTLSESVEMITCAAGANMIKESPLISEKLFDFALKHTVKAALLEHADKGEWVDLDVHKGTAFLTGLVSSPIIKNKCENFVLNIEGIKSVDSQLTIRDQKTAIY